MSNQTALATPATPYNKLKELIAGDTVQQRFASLLGKRAHAYLASVLTLASDPKLVDCEPTSILTAAAKGAILDLPVDPNLGFAWLIPFKADGKKIATFLIGYKGYIQLGLRSGQYQALNVTEIYEGEEVKEDRLSGRIVLNGKRTGDTVTGYVAYFKLINGFEKFVYMSKDEIVAHAKKFSKSWGYKDSPWTTSFDWMAKKTVLRRLLSKYGIMSIQMMGVIENDADEVPLDMGSKFEPQTVIDGEFHEAGTSMPNFDDLKEEEPQPDPNLPLNDLIVAFHLAENVFEAGNMLKKRSESAELQPLEWARVYRGWRDRGETSDNAAALANEGKLP